MKSFTEFPAGKLKSKITLRSSVSFLETVFNGEILKWPGNGFLSKGPIIAENPW